MIIHANFAYINFARMCSMRNPIDIFHSYHEMIYALYINNCACILK